MACRGNNYLRCGALKALSSALAFIPMKRADLVATIINRQNRVVYTLLIVSAAIGLAWVLWRHQYLLTHNRLAPVASPVAPAR